MEENDDLQKAGQILREAEETIIRNCGQEIDEILKKYNCIIVPQVVLRGDQIIPQSLIVLKKQS